MIRRCTITLSSSNRQVLRDVAVRQSTSTTKRQTSSSSAASASSGPPSGSIDEGRSKNKSKDDEDNNIINNNNNNNNSSSKNKNSLGKIIKDDYANFRDDYKIPKYPIVLAHGLLGFDQLQLAPRWSRVPGVQYWRGIREALEQRGVQVVTTTVPMTGSIEERAKVLHEQIKAKMATITTETNIGSDSSSSGGRSTEKDTKKSVNIIAHSMGGLDSRYLISRIRPTEFKIRSLTTIASPHRGSSIADMLFRDIGETNVAALYRLLARLKIDTGAFAQLTCKYMQETFNPATPNLDLAHAHAHTYTHTHTVTGTGANQQGVDDQENVRYFSYGASATPHILSIFRLSHALLDVVEGPNDGLVSVESSKWGDYRGTLMGVTHLDLINWTNRIKRLAARAGLIKRLDFNAIAFYLAIADMLAKEGL